MQKTPTALRPLIEDIKQELQGDLETKKLSFDISFSAEADAALPNIDPRLMKEALFNILDNAVKYTKAGGITVKGEKHGTALRLTFHDTGIGMTKEELDKCLSSAFERGEEAKTLYATGRGIGLMLSKNIVEAHGGTLTASSEGRGRGTEMVVEMRVG